MVVVGTLIALLPELGGRPPRCNKALHGRFRQHGLNSQPISYALTLSEFSIPPRINPKHAQARNRRL